MSSMRGCGRTRPHPPLLRRRLARRDLQPAKRAVQAIHAAIEAAREGLIPPGIEHPHLVLLSVSDAAALVALSGRLAAAGVSHRAFPELDLAGRITALATGPLAGRARRQFKNLPLMEG